MIPVDYYRLISDQVRKGLEESYEDMQGANWEDARELAVQNVMNKICEYLQIETEEDIFFEFDEDDETDD